MNNNNNILTLSEVGTLHFAFYVLGLEGHGPCGPMTHSQWGNATAPLQPIVIREVISDEGSHPSWGGRHRGDSPPPLRERVEGREPKLDLQCWLELGAVAGPKLLCVEYEMVWGRFQPRSLMALNSEGWWSGDDLGHTRSLLRASEGHREVWPCIPAPPPALASCSHVPSLSQLAVLVDLARSIMSDSL